MRQLNLQSYLPRLRVDGTHLAILRVHPATVGLITWKDPFTPPPIFAGDVRTA